MKNLIFLSFVWLSFSSLAQTQNPVNPNKIKLLVITGGPTLTHHINLVPTSFYTLFAGYDNITWDHATHDEAAFQSERLQEYDMVLMYNRSDSISEKSKQNIRIYLESGKGLIVLHHALGSYNNWEWWWKNVVGGKYQMKETDDIAKSDYKQGEKIDMTAQKQHFITETIGNFELTDETYRNLWISDEAEIIYSTSNSTSDGPTVWIGPYNDSKVLVIQPGHAETAHLDTNYKLLIYIGVLWVTQNK